MPSEPDSPLPVKEASSCQEEEHEASMLYENVAEANADYANITKDALEMVEDQIYDYAQSMTYQRTATDAHVKAVDMASAHIHKPTSLSDTQKSDKSSSNPMGGRQWPHLVKNTVDNTHKIPQTYISPVHHSSVSQDTLEGQHKQKRRAIISPHSRSSLEVPGRNEPPTSPNRAYINFEALSPTSLQRATEKQNLTPVIPLTLQKRRPVPIPRRKAQVDLF